MSEKLHPHLRLKRYEQLHVLNPFIFSVLWASPCERAVTIEKSIDTNL